MLTSASISMLYKRAFRKGKEVTTFLVKGEIVKSDWNFTIKRCFCYSEPSECALVEEQAVYSPPTGTDKTLAGVPSLRTPIAIWLGVGLGIGATIALLAYLLLVRKG